jgi:hypothetical protein
VKLARIRNAKDACFLSHMEDRSKDKHTQRMSMIYINSAVKHVCNEELLYGTQEKRERKREC